jgi:two-component system sensor histidine kinase HydH
MRSPVQSPTVRRWWAPYLVISVPLVLLVVNCIRGAYCDVQMIRSAALRSEMSSLRAQAVFQVGRMETLLEVHAANDEPWSNLREQSWIRSYWTSLQAQDPQRLYVAITDPSGQIVLHSDPSVEGQRLGPDWYDQRIPEAGPDVTYAAASPLSGKHPAYDLHVPIELDKRGFGDFHVGMSEAWLNNNIAGLQRQALVGWAWLLALAIVADIAALYGLTALSGHRQNLSERLRDAVRLRSRELAQLGAGLAHEMRNPLHALRMNLHTLKRAIGQNSPLSREQLVATVSDSDAVIDRLDVLLRDLVQFTSPSQGEKSRLDLVAEMRATLNLLSEDLGRTQTEVHSQLPAEPVPVIASPACLRQVLLNLLTFAQHGGGQKRQLDVQVQTVGGQAEIALSNHGLKMSEEQLAHMFDPFQAPNETGSGLGLAVVRCLLEDLDGTVCGAARPAGGVVLRVRLPLAPVPESGVTA